MIPQKPRHIEDEERDRILNSNFNFSTDSIKNLFPKIKELDLDEIKKLLLKKVDDLKMELRTYHPSTLHRMTADEFSDEMSNYIALLNIEYDKFGLKEKYNKIKKVLEVIPENSEYKIDLQIVKEIKKEYIKTKKLNKSSMLYLNKIYKQLIQGKDDEEKKDKEYESEFASLARIIRRSAD